VRSRFASIVESLDERRLEPAFAAALREGWSSAPMRALRAQRLVLREGGTAALAAAMTLTDEALRREADVAEHGLRACALPGCGAEETSVHEFKRCGACRSVAYCCAAHGAAHWAREDEAGGGHKRACRALSEQQRAARATGSHGGAEPA
jgi:hypothetical protein